MRKSIILTLTIFFAGLANLSAQSLTSENLQIEFGNVISKSESRFGYFVPGNDGALFSRNSDRRGKTTLVQYADLNLDEQIKITELIEIGKKGTIQKITRFNDALVIFYSIIDKSDKTNTLYYVVLSQENMDVIMNDEKLLELTYEKVFSKGGFSIIASRKRSKMLIYASVRQKKRKGEDPNEKFDIMVMNTDFEIEWTNQVTLPYPSRRFGVSGFQVDEEGTVYCFGSYYPKKKSGDSDKAGRRLIKFVDEGEDHVEVPIELASNQKIHSLGYIIKTDGRIICSGFYGGSVLIGTYYLEIDPDAMEVVHEREKRFEVDFLTEGMSNAAANRVAKKRNKGKNIGLTSFVPRGFIDNPDGGLTLMAEFYRVVEHCSTDANGNRTCTYTYYYNDIILVGLSPDGEIEWNKKIIKRQVSTNDGGYFSSYNTFTKDDQIHIMFYDEGRDVPGLGLSRSDKTAKKARKASHLVHVSIDMNTGEDTYESTGQFSRKRKYMRPVCKRFYGMNTGETYMYFETPRDYRIGKITAE